MMTVIEYLRDAVLRGGIPTLDVDANPDHPTVVFFTDRETLATVACDAVTGHFIGACGNVPDSVQYAATLFAAEKAQRRN